MSGNALNIRMKLLEPVKRSIIPTFGQIFVRTTLVAKDHFLSQLERKSETSQAARPF